MHGEIHRLRPDFDVFAFPELTESFGVDEAAGLAALLGIDDVAQRHFDVVVSHSDIDIGFQFETRHHEIALHILDLLVRTLQKLACVLSSDRFQDFGDCFHIAGISHRNANLVPDIAEGSRVIEDGSTEDLRVGKLNRASTVLIAADPVANLHHARVEEADVNHIATQFIDLDAIATGVHVAGKNGDASGDAEQWLPQRDRQTSSDKSPELSLKLELTGPNHNQRRDCEYGDGSVHQTIKPVVLFGRDVARLDDLAGKQGSAPRQEENP